MLDFEFDRLLDWFHIALGISPAPADFCIISGRRGGGGNSFDRIGSSLSCEGRGAAGAALLGEKFCG